MGTARASTATTGDPAEPAGFTEHSGHAAAEVIGPLRAIEQRMGDAERGLIASRYPGPDHAASARNLLHYLALRESDARPLQNALRGIGLSSLGRAEGCALATIRAVRVAAESLAGAPVATTGPDAPVTIERADTLRDERARAALGGTPAGRETRIMVTLPDEAATDPDIARGLVEAGADIARINAAHGEIDDWRRMAAHVRAARPGARLHIDLAGPNPRTGPMPPEATSIRIRAGDRVTLVEGRGSMVEPGHARLACTLPEVFRHARAGERVFFDDGRAEAVIDSAGPRGLELRVTEAGPDGIKIRAGKGINLPDTRLDLPALMPGDLDTLACCAAGAGDRAIEGGVEQVGLSFARSAADVRACSERLPPEVTLVVKIETRAAFEDLPAILLTLLERPTAAVMIARGDLAVEVGVERLAEAQEQILWLCEAAHLPVIWATQVLERLAKKGRATRAEVTDAAMSGRAECVMLNKGPHIARAVRTLDDILRRMQDHQSKKRAMLRPLGVARRFAMRTKP